ncbi:NAD(P)-dependent alcohol dehydrogenase [Microbacterium aerolatum]|uniref:NAD(P)-dependent alcohol dehydrogenase n=1 Tax=Microbacterium aerolatum TaxID=153731 RepID=UPI0020010EF4|nr:NAD(P)-dependent alcohol dehydrogenase [Microbacterium aerolatum]MCK3769458.1 NAD(P)-dependent alcohol dehydrogenase [Microbacterium aerolatum]
MPAWLNDRYGSATGTRQATVSTPQPGRGEVLLRIRATALNAADVRLMLGDPLLLRPMFGIRRPKQPIRGNDVAGTVVAVGEGVDASRIGEEVVVELSSGGGLAPYAIARADRLVARPDALAPEVAATLPISGGTAVQALDAAGVSRGQRVLVIGASGGVGTFVVQLAALRGAEVWATCGEPNRALVETLGATRTFDYRTTDLASLPASFDAIIEIAGSRPLRRLTRLLTPTGVVAMVGGDGGRVLGPIPRILRGLLLSIGSRRSIRMVAAVAKRDVNEQLVALVLAGRITPVIERTLPWDAAVEGLARLESGHTVGKVVVLGCE